MVDNHRLLLHHGHVDSNLCNCLHPTIDQFAIHDSALSSEDGSGLHTPTINTPISAFSSLPNNLPPINDPETAQPSFSYHHIDYPPPYLLDNGVPEQHHILLHHQPPQYCGSFTHDMSLPSNHLHSHLNTPSIPAVENEHSSIRVPPASSQHPSIPKSQSMATTEPRHPTASQSAPAAKREPSRSPPPQSQKREQPQAGSATGSDTNQASSPTAASQRTGRGTSGMVIACKQCRSRKIRCDSTRPVCNNCTRRCSACEYDIAPKRRGPDKRPGTRQRTCKKKPADDLEPPNKRKRTDEPMKDKGGGPSRQLNAESTPPRAVTTSVDSPLQLQTQSPLEASSSSSLPLYPPPTHPSPSPLQAGGLEKAWSYIRESRNEVTEYSSYNMLSGETYDTVDNILDLDRKSSISIPEQPSSQYSRKVWWEDLMNTYSTNRADSLQAVVEDLKFLFSSTSYWLACFNVPVFLRTVCDPAEREQLQPSLILSGLALATLMKSSEIGLGESGRNRALFLRDAAQAYLEASFQSQWIDPTLAQAALILALFEASAHPKHTPSRAAHSLMYLDTIIRTLALTCLDADDPDTSVFPPKAVPSIPRETMPGGVRQCSCETSPLTASSVTGQTSTSSWSCAPAWDPNWTIAEVRKEESRRLCWSALTLVAAHTADCAAVRRKPLDLQLIKPSNYAILFPGEILTREDKTSPPHPPKESVWALYARSMLLWNSCAELSHEDVSDNEKAEFALQAWMEADVIEDALNCHICSAEQASLFVGRDYLLNTRMTITQELRRYVPLPTSGAAANPFFSRKKAEDWLKYQRGVAQKVKSTLHLLSEGQGKVLASRPFYVWWFMGQIAISMSLWTYDPTLIQALEICHEYLAPIDVLTYLWPCSVQRVRYLALREKLVEASVAAGIPPPPPPNFSIPSHPIV